MILRIIFIFCLGHTFLLSTAFAKKQCPKKCYPMLMLRVIDGDSVQGYIHTNDKEAVIFATLRLEGIDTAEISRSKCIREKLHGLQAKLYLKEKLAPLIRQRSTKVSCACDYQGGKFSKRRVGILKIKVKDNWQNVGTLLKSKCFAVPYTKGKRPNWCNCLKNKTCPSKFFTPKCIKTFSKLK